MGCYLLGLLNRINLTFTGVFVIFAVLAVVGTIALFTLWMDSWKDSDNEPLKKVKSIMFKIVYPGLVLLWLLLIFIPSSDEIVKINCDKNLNQNFERILKNECE